MALDPRFGDKVSLVTLLFVGDKTLRVDPSDTKKVDANGGEEKHAFWEWVDLGDGVVRLKNRVNHHCLRIYDGGNQLDARGGGGRYTKLKVHKGDDNSLKFESVQFPGTYVGCFEGVVKADKVGCGFQVKQKQVTDDSEEVKITDESLIADELDVERIPAGDWPGTGEWVKIYADNEFVVVGTDVIGKYPGSLFHEKLVALRRDATHGKGAMVRMRFDRLFEFLQLIIAAMRGYPIETKPMDAFKRRMFVADCDFYRLPSIVASLKPVEPTTPTTKPTTPTTKPTTPTTKPTTPTTEPIKPTPPPKLTLSDVNWDPVSKKVVVSGSGHNLEHKSDGKCCSSLNVAVKRGEAKWVEIEIEHFTLFSFGLAFGVVELAKFNADGGPMTSDIVCFDVESKTLAWKPTGEICTAGNRIRMRLCMDASGESALFTVFRNDTEIGTEELSHHFALDSTLLFVARTRCAGTKLRLVGAGICQPLSRSEVNWNLTRIDPKMIAVVHSKKLLKHTGADQWTTSRVNVVVKGGESKYVDFELRKGKTLFLMFGVTKKHDFSTDGYFGHPIEGAGYSPEHGYLRFRPFGPYTIGGVVGATALNETSGSFPVVVGDKFRIHVKMDALAKSAQFTVLKNGVRLGAKEISKFLVLDSELVFAVCTHNHGDEVQIV